MSCNCNKALTNTACIANYLVGKADSGIDYQVYFKTPSGRTDVYPVTSDMYGLIVVETPKVRIGEVYEIYVTLPGSNVRVPFIIGGPLVPILAGSDEQDNGTDVYCANVEFTACFEDGEYLAPIDQTLTLEE